MGVNVNRRAPTNIYGRDAFCCPTSLYNNIVVGKKVIFHQYYSNVGGILLSFRRQCYHRDD